MKESFNDDLGSFTSTQIFTIREKGIIRDDVSVFWRFYLNDFGIPITYWIKTPISC